MGLRMQTDAQTGSAQYGGAHRGGRAFAGRASDVDGSERALGMVQSREQRAHAVEPAREAGRQRLADGAIQNLDGGFKVHPLHPDAACSPTLPRKTSKACPKIGEMTARVSRTAFGLPGRLTMSVRLRTAAIARERIA